MSTPMYREAINTLRASKWERRLAQLFGDKVVDSDGVFRTTCYRWRGKAYLVDFQPLPPAPAAQVELGQLLDLLRAHPNSSSAQLAELAGVDLRQVQPLVCTLVQRGLIVQTGQAERPAGRRPQPLYSLPVMLAPELASRLITTGSLMALTLEQLPHAALPYDDPQASIARLQDSLPRTWQALLTEAGAAPMELSVRDTEASPCA